MREMRDRLEAPMLVGVGAAFDFHAGLVPQAPAWMQATGLEWVFRLAQEPRRLWRRYVALQPALRRGVRAAVPRARAPVASLARHGARRLGHRPRPRRPAAGAVVRRPRPERRRRRQRRRAPGRRPRGPHAVPGERRRRRSWTASTPPGGWRSPTASPTPRSARHIVITLGTPVVLAHRDRHARHPLGARRPAAGAPARPLAHPALDDRAEHDRVRRGLPREERAASTSATDVFVSHAPERIAAGRFFEEIDTLPQIVGGVGERSGEVCAELFDVFDAPVVQTTPVQAELAKIWTNILRYATFALPNLLMMDCEQYDANVFEVIDLINEDYPRGGIEDAGLHRRHLPAQGLHVQRGALERPGHAARRLARQRERPAVPRRGHEAPPRRHAQRPQGRGARPGLQGRHRRRARLARPQAHPPARARARRRRGPRPDRRHADAGVRGGARAAPTRSSSPPTTARSAARSACARSARSPGRTRCSSTPGTASASRRCSPTPPRRPRWPAAPPPTSHELRQARPRHRRRRHDRRGGRAAAAGRSRLGRPRLRPARGAAVDARGLRGPHRRPARRRPGARGDRGLLARHPPRGDRRRHRQLPQAAAHADRGEQRRSTTASSARRSTTTSSASSTSRARWSSSAPTEYPTPEEYVWRHADPEVGLRVLQAHRRGLLPRRARRARPAVHDLPPVQRLRPGRDARGRARHRAHGPRRHQEGPVGPEAAADLRRRHADADDHPHRRHRRRDRHRDGLARGPERGLQHLAPARR